MGRTGVFSVNNNASSSPEWMIGGVSTAAKEAHMLRNNLISNSTYHWTPRHFSDKKGKRKSSDLIEKIDNRGKRKRSGLIDFFSIDNRKIPKLGPPGLEQSSSSLIKEEDITLQIGIGNKEEVLQQQCMQVTHELQVTKAELKARNAELEITKAELQRIGKENSLMHEEIDQLNNLVGNMREDYSYQYQQALRHKGHQGNYTVPSRTQRKMFPQKQHIPIMPLLPNSGPFRNTTRMTVHR